MKGKRKKTTPPTGKRGIFLSDAIYFAQSIYKKRVNLCVYMAPAETQAEREMLCMAQVCIHDSFDLFGFFGNEKQEKIHKIPYETGICIAERPNEIFGPGQFEKIVFMQYWPIYFRLPDLLLLHFLSFFTLSLTLCVRDFLLLRFLCSKSFPSCKMVIPVTK